MIGWAACYTDIACSLTVPTFLTAHVEKSLHLLQAIKPEYVGFSVAYPLRGTVFYEEVKDYISVEQ